MIQEKPQHLSIISTELGASWDWIRLCLYCYGTRIYMKSSLALEKQQRLSIISTEKSYQVGHQLRLDWIFFIFIVHFSQCRDHCTDEFSFPTCYGTRTNMKSSLTTAKPTESINNCNGKNRTELGANWGGHDMGH